MPFDFQEEFFLFSLPKVFSKLLYYLAKTTSVTIHDLSQGIDPRKRRPFLVLRSCTDSTCCQQTDVLPGSTGTILTLTRAYPQQQSRCFLLWIIIGEPFLQLLYF